MKRLGLALILALWSSLAAAQWQVPTGNIPIGRGDPVTGFTSVAPGANGNCLFVAGGVFTSTPCPGATLTGTVTSVTCNAGLTGGTFTTTGTCALDPAYTGFAEKNCTLSASVASNLLTVSLKDNAGSDPSATSPCLINYRSVTPATGQTTAVAQTAALSISTNAVGATLGTSNSTAFRFWVVSFNNGGTNVLALYNASTSAQCRPLDEAQVQTSVAISGSATSAGVYYTPNGTTVTSKAIRIIGYVEYSSTGLATAGTYSSGPTFIQPFGPGVRRPCDTVQSVFTSTATLQTSSSAAYPTVTSSGMTASLSMSSAANLVRLNANANPQNGLGGGVQLGIYRANTTFACTTAVGIGKTISVGSAIVISVGLGFASIDKPNIAGSSAAVIYSYCFGAVSIAGSVAGADLVVEEIMG